MKDPNFSIDGTMTVFYENPEMYRQWLRGQEQLDKDIRAYVADHFPLCFVANGLPKGEPRARSGGRGPRAVYPNHSADTWKRVIRRAALKALSLLLPPTAPVFAPGCPVGVTAVFRMPRPAAHHVARDTARPLQTKAPKWPTPKPDIDNLVKAALDALGAWPRGGRPIAWADDQQVVAIFAVKRYATEGQPPGVSIYAREQPNE